jgi:hypothetical protein
MVLQIIKRKQNHKETISHGSPCDSTINHKETISHGAHDISQCTMTTQLTPLNNYLSNCVITSSYTPSYSTITSVLKLGLGVRVLHGPKDDQSLCNVLVVVLSLKIMEYVLSCPEGIA